MNNTEVLKSLTDLYKGQLDYKGFREQVPSISTRVALEVVDSLTKEGILWSSFTPVDEDQPMSLAMVVLVGLRPKLFEGILLPKGYKAMMETLTESFVSYQGNAEFYKTLVESTGAYYDLYFGTNRSNSKLIYKYQHDPSRLELATLEMLRRGEVYGGGELTTPDVPSVRLHNPVRTTVGYVNPVKGGSRRVLTCPKCGATVKVGRNQATKLYCAQDKELMK